MLKASNLRDMSVEELEATLSDLNKELYHLLNEAKRVKKLGSTQQLRIKRKERARLLTIMHEKQSVPLHTI